MPNGILAATELNDARPSGETAESGLVGVYGGRERPALFFDFRFSVSPRVN